MIAIDRVTNESIRLLTQLRQSKIRFAHWKGNSHLKESLEGKTDIELLVNPEDRELFETVVNNLGFKKLQSQNWNTYPEVDDWIGFDYETGNLLHLHTHYALVIALGYGNYFTLPWQREFFKHLTIDENTQWPIPEPEMEVTILLIRIYAKIKVKPHKEKEIIKGKKGELLMLLKSLKLSKLKILWEQLSLVEPKNLVPRIKRIIIEGNIQDIKYLAKHLVIQLPSSLTAVTHNYALKSYYYKFYLRALRTYARFNQPLSFKKRIFKGGKIIALVGSDGSGKSTLSNDLTKWLTFKIDTHYFYLGKKPFIRSYDINNYSLIDLIASNNKFSRALKKAAGSLYHLLVIKRKANMLQLAKKMSSNGSIIICDRFPQKDIIGMNDGPKLQGSSSSWPSQVEIKVYDQILESTPDLVIRLQVSPEVAHNRKPEHSFSLIKRKCENIGKLSFGKSKVVDMDANKPYNEVLLAIKREIWQSIISPTRLENIEPSPISRSILN